MSGDIVWVSLCTSKFQTSGCMIMDFLHLYTVLEINFAERWQQELYFSSHFNAVNMFLMDHNFFGLF